MAVGNIRCYLQNQGLTRAGANLALGALGNKDEFHIDFDSRELTV